ncbi:MAG: ABC transporter permease subunit [Solirubrobacteraceae bacterium]
MTPFSATLRSEWTKISSLRSTKVMLASSLILALALSALLANVVGNTWDDWKPADRRDYEPIGAALIGGLASAILFLVIGVKAATAEYGAGMMRLTLTATPRRRRVLAAKALVVTAVTLVAALVCNVAMFLEAHAILGVYGIETTSLGDADALRAVLGSAALAPLFPVIGLALGIALRSTAATIIAVLAVIFGPPFIGGVLPHSWQGDALEYVPMAASDAISLGHLPDAAAGLSPAVAALVVAAWLAVFLGAAWAIFERRDA